MAGVEAIHSVGDSVVTFLRRSFPNDVRVAIGVLPTFSLVSSAQLSGDDANFAPGVTLYLYRATINEQSRNSWVGNHRVLRKPLPLDLHFLITVWAGTPHQELTLLAWVMRQLHEHPVLDMARLSPEGQWRAGEVVNVVPAELSNEDLMRIWDTLGPNYRLSVSYLARVVQIDPIDTETAQPVVAQRIDVRDLEDVDAV